MLPYIGLGVAVGAYFLLKSGKVKMIAKRVISQQLSDLMQVEKEEEMEDFLHILEAKKKSRNQPLRTGSYVFKDSSTMMKAAEFINFSYSVSMNVNTETKRMKLIFSLSKDSVTHKFVINGQFKTEGQCLEFSPTDGDLEVLPEIYRKEGSMIPLFLKVVNKNEHEDKIFVGFNSNQVGQDTALLFDTE